MNNMKISTYYNPQMKIPWNQYSESNLSVSAKDTELEHKASIIGRAGLIMLSCGTTAYRVRNAMLTIAKVLAVDCSAEIGLLTINLSCYSTHESYTISLSLKGVGVNTNKLHKIQQYIEDFEEKYSDLGVNENHRILDKISSVPALYSTPVIAFAAAFACASFMFNLGGGVAEIICVFIAAGLGNLVRHLSGKANLSAMIGVVGGAVTSCIVYAATVALARIMFPGIISTGSGYIGSVLYLVPGFPFITSILDLAKLDMRSGIERLVYSFNIMAFATVFCWVAAISFGLDPAVGNGIVLTPVVRLILRLVASFVGVVGFSVIFNSPIKMALSAACIGCIANTLRLELVDYTNISAVICSFIGSFVVGLLAGFLVKRTGYPRVGITVPAVVVAVPGLFMYRAIFYMGTGNINEGFMFLIKAAAIVFAIGLGILFSRYITDPAFRHKQ